MRSSTVRSPDVPFSATRRLFEIAGGGAVLLAAGGTAFAIRRLVAADWLDDRTIVAITAATGLALAAGTLVAYRLALRRSGLRRRLAAGLVPVGLIAVCGAFIVASVADVSVAMQALVEEGGPQPPPATVVLGPKGDDVRLTGELREGVARRLSALLEAHPNVRRIHLTSEGGLADEGQALGDVIAAHGLTTFVPDYCVSACTLAFVRGRERLLRGESRIGFHSPFEEGLFGTTYQGDSSLQRAQYLSAGVTAAFVDAALKVKPDDVWFPKPDALIAAHVATAVAPRDSLPDSNLDGAATLEGAKAALLRDFPVLAAFHARSPEALDRVGRWYLDAYRDERSEDQNADDLRTIVGSAVLVALTRAEDDVLLEAGRYLAQGMAAADDAESCVRIGGEADFLEAEAQLEARDDKADSRARTIVAAAADGRRQLGTKRDGGILAALAGDDETEIGEADCRAARRAYESLLRGPPIQAAAVLRRLADSRARMSLADLQAVIARH